MATNEDLEELLTISWITRIWTYQEIILATHPVMVCGDHHIPWSQFSFGITFLHFISQFYGFEASLTALTATWMRILVTKGHVIKHRDASDSNKRARYERFLDRISPRFVVISNCLVGLMVFLMCLIICGLGILLGIGLTVGILLPADSNNPGANQKLGDWTRQQWVSLLIGIAVLVPNLTVLLFVLSLHWFLAFSSRIGIAKLSRKRREFSRDILDNGSPADDLVSAIYFRQATNPMDHVFGVRAVLETLMNRRLPAPDYSTPLDELYKELTIQILEATGSPLILIPAALTHQQGWPSWIPNWQANIEAHKFWMASWRPTFALQSAATSKNITDRNWKVNMQSNSLMVLGLPLCSVAAFFTFQETSNTYVESEENLHIENLRSMLILSESESGIRLMRFLFSRYNNTSSDRQHEIDLDTYLNRLLRNRSRNASRLFARLKIRRAVGSPWRKLSNCVGLRRHHSSSYGALRAHIWMCNSLARSDRRIFLATNLPPLDVPRQRSSMATAQKVLDDVRSRYADTFETVKPKAVGLCTGDASVGDFVTAISGLSLLLVLRPNGSSYQVISPAVLESAVPGESHSLFEIEAKLEELTLS
jgi:hypothetical protein